MTDYGQKELYELNRRKVSNMEWIKCSDKMPDLYQWVLVCNSPKGTDEPRIISICHFDGDEWCSPNRNGNDWIYCATFTDITYHMVTEDITFWMPLPEKPQGNMEWIKCSDRMPPKDNPVLCYYDDLYIDVMEYWYDDDNGKHVFYNPPSPPHTEVTHWMPLPDKPESYT